MATRKPAKVEDVLRRVPLIRKETDVTMADLQKAAGQRTRQAIMKWVRLGLLPFSTMVPGRSGRGRRGVWAASALERVRFICARTDQGHTLEDVLVEVWKHEEPQSAELEKRAAQVTRRWTAPGSVRRSANSREHGPSEDVSIHDEWVAAIQASLKNVGLPPATARRLAEQAGDSAILKRVLWSYLWGFEPLLLISNGRVKVSSSATVGFEHSNVVRRAVSSPAVMNSQTVTGRITLQIKDLIEELLVRSGDYARPHRIYLPPPAVDQIDLFHPVVLRHKQNVYVDEDGELGGGLYPADQVITDSIFRAPLAAGAFRELVPPVDQPQPARRKKLRPRKRKARRS